MVGLPTEAAPLAVLVHPDIRTRGEIVELFGKGAYRVIPAVTLAEAELVARNHTAVALLLVVVPQATAATFAALERLAWSHPAARFLLLTDDPEVHAKALGYATSLPSASTLAQLAMALANLDALRARSAASVQWLHEQQVHLDCGHNVTRTAKRLGKDRKTVRAALSVPRPAR